MKKLFSAITKTIIAAVFAWIGLGAPAGAQQSSPYHVLLLQDITIRNVFVETSGGSISVVHDDAANPRVEMYVESSGRKKLGPDQIARIVYDHYQLQLKTEESRLELVALRSDGNYNREIQLNISFKIVVPDPAVNLHLKTSGGALDLESVHGQIDAKTSGGSIRVRNCHGEIRLATSGGNIMAQQSSGDLNLETSRGALSMKALHGKITAITSSGTVNADDIEGRLSVATSHGAIKLSKIQGKLDASTSHGDIEARMTKVDSPVVLKTANGRIVLKVPDKTGIDLELEGPRVDVPNLQDFAGRAGNTQIKGKLHGGGAPLQARALRGRVKLVFENGMLE